MKPRIIAGFCASPPLAMACVALIGAASPEWSHVYGGPGVDYFVDIQATSSEGCVVAGSTESFGAQYRDDWIMRLSPAGDIMWQKRIGGWGWEHPYDLVQCVDGAFLMGGDTQSFGSGGFDAWMVKLSASGKIAWQRAYGGPGDEALRRILPTQDGGHLVVGAVSTMGDDNWDGWLLKLDSTGGISWQRSYGGPTRDYFKDAVQMMDGGYLAVGATNSFGAINSNGWAMRLGPNGDILWQRRYGTKDTYWFKEVSSAPDNGVLIGGGVIGSGASDPDVWLVRLGPTGEIVWQKRYGAELGDTLGSLVDIRDSCYLLSGSTDVKASDWGYHINAWLLSIDPEGKILWQKRYAGAESFLGVRPLLAQGDGFLAIGESWGLSKWVGMDAIVVRLSSSGSLDPLCQLEAVETSVSPVQTRARTHPTSARAIPTQAKERLTSARPRSTNSATFDACE